MADVTLTWQGQILDAQAGDLLLPRAGAWTAHLQLADADVVPEGAVTVTWMGTTLKGYVLRGSLQEGRVSVLVAGGAGGLWRPVQAKMYDYSLAVSLPLREILAEVGETLSPTSSPAIISATLPNWIRQAAEAGMLLDDLARQVGALWRVLPDGSIFFGADEWTDITLSFLEDKDYTLLSQDPVADMAVIAPLTMGVLPGAQWRERRVGTVHATLSPGEARTRVWFLRDDARTGDDPLRVGLEGLIRETMRGVDYHACYPGRVVTQRGNGTLDVVLDSPRLPPLTSVPYRVPVPGAKLTVASGARVLVSFAGGDPTKYHAELYEPGGATKEVVLTGDQVDAGTLTLIVTGGAMAPAVLSGTYVDPFGTSTTIASGVSIPLKGKARGTATLLLP